MLITEFLPLHRDVRRRFVRKCTVLAAMSHADSITWLLAVSERDFRQLPARSIYGKYVDGWGRAITEEISRRLLARSRDTDTDGPGASFEEIAAEMDVRFPDTAPHSVETVKALLHSGMMKLRRLAGRGHMGTLRCLMQEKEKGERYTEMPAHLRELVDRWDEEEAA